MTIFKRLLKNIFRTTAMTDANGTFIRWQTVHDLVHRIMSLKELREFWPACDGLVVDEGLQIAGDDYDTIFLLQDVLSQRLGRDCHFPVFVLGSEKQTLGKRVFRILFWIKRILSCESGVECIFSLRMVSNVF